jgi:hypothetical protein
MVLCIVWRFNDSWMTFVGGDILRLFGLVLLPIICGVIAVQWFIGEVKKGVYINNQIYTWKNLSNLQTEAIIQEE